MQVGLKFYRPQELAGKEKTLESVDFLEFMALQNEDYSVLRDFGIPITLHCEHDAFGINYANPKKLEENNASLKFALKTADFLDCKALIAHPGINESKECSAKFAAEFLKKFNDKRILVETMPLVHKKGFEYCSSIESAEKFLKASEKKLCLDVAHSAEAGIALGKDPLEFVKKMGSLKPMYFHFSDSLIENKERAKSHLHFFEGNLPLEEFKKLVPKKASVTIETFFDERKSLEEIEFLRH